MNKISGGGGAGEPINVTGKITNNDNSEVNVTGSINVTLNNPIPDIISKIYLEKDNTVASTPGKVSVKGNINDSHEVNGSINIDDPDNTINDFKSIDLNNSDPAATTTSSSSTTTPPTAAAPAATTSTINDLVLSPIQTDDDDENKVFVHILNMFKIYFYARNIMKVLSSIEVTSDINEKYNNKETYIKTFIEKYNNVSNSIFKFYDDNLNKDVKDIPFKSKQKELIENIDNNIVQLFDYSKYFFSSEKKLIGKNIIDKGTNYEKYQEIEQIIKVDEVSKNDISKIKEILTNLTDTDKNTERTQEYKNKLIKIIGDINTELAKFDSGDYEASDPITEISEPVKEVDNNENVKQIVNSLYSMIRTHTKFIETVYENEGKRPSISNKIYGQIANNFGKNIYNINKNYNEFIVKHYFDEKYKQLHSNIEKLIINTGKILFYGSTPEKFRLLTIMDMQDYSISSVDLLNNTLKDNPLDYVIDKDSSESKGLLGSTVDIENYLFFILRYAQIKDILFNDYYEEIYKEMYNNVIICINNIDKLLLANNETDNQAGGATIKDKSLSKLLEGIKKIKQHLLNYTMNIQIWYLLIQNIK